MEIYCKKYNQYKVYDHEVYDAAAGADDDLTCFCLIVSYIFKPHVLCFRSTPHVFMFYIFMSQDFFPSDLGWQKTDLRQGQGCYMSGSEPEKMSRQKFEHSHRDVCPEIQKRNQNVPKFANNWQNIKDKSALQIQNYYISQILQHWPRVPISIYWGVKIESASL